jgi:hypothetical protein
VRSDIEGNVADGRADGNFDRVRRIDQADRFDGIDNAFLCGVGFSKGKPVFQPRGFPAGTTTAFESRLFIIFAVWVGSESGDVSAGTPKPANP